MNNKIKLDELDKKILRILQEDASISNKDLAKKVGIAPSSCLMRVKGLISSGLIKKQVAVLNEKLLGYQITAFLTVELKTVNQATIEAFLKEALMFPQILQCYMITGGGTFLMKVVAQDIEDYRDFVIKQLTSIENVGNVESSIVMSTEKDTDYMPI